MLPMDVPSCGSVGLGIGTNVPFWLNAFSLTVLNWWVSRNPPVAVGNPSEVSTVKRPRLNCVGVNGLKIAAVKS